MKQQPSTKSRRLVETTMRIREEFFNCFGTENVSVECDQPLRFRASTTLPAANCPATVDVQNASVWLILGEQGGMDFAANQQGDLETVVWLINAARKGAVTESWWLSRKGVSLRYELNIEYEDEKAGRIDLGPKWLAAEIRTVKYLPW